MLSQVRKQPAAVVKLQSLLTKLGSMLDIPLMRLTQAQLPEASSTSHKLSSWLMAFSARLLQVWQVSLLLQAPFAMFGYDMICPYTW